MLKPIPCPIPAEALEDTQQVPLPEVLNDELASTWMLSTESLRIIEKRRKHLALKAITECNAANARL